VSSITTACDLAGSGLKVGDIITFSGPTIRYRWWERLLRRLTFGWFRGKGVKEWPRYTITAIEPNTSTLTVLPGGEHA
jgi:hypothetical protein